MSHYWLATEAEPARRAQLEDWLEDVEEFGPAIVANACREWRRQPGARRPTPGDIRTRCLTEQREQRQHRALTGPSDMDAYARSVGFANNAERMEAIRRDLARRDDPANFERLKALELELRGQRAGKAVATRAFEGWSAEDMLRGRVALGLEPDPAAERLRQESIEEERAIRDRLSTEAAE